jgi:hypothetical protein
MMNNKTVFRVSCAAVVIMCSAVAGVAGERGKSLTISESKDGDGVVVAVSAALAREFLEGAIGSELECDGELDPDFERMLRTLDRGGRGSSASMGDADSRITARRTGKKMRLDIRDLDDGGRIEATVPWTVAECMLGKKATLDASAAKIKIKIKGSDGGSFEFKID